MAGTFLPVEMETEEMFYGKYALPMNKDGSLILPSAFRPGLTRDVIYLTQGLDHNILVLTSSVFERICAQLNTISMTDPLARMLNRLILGNAVPVNAGPDGTLQIPPELRQYAKFSGEVTLVGQGEYLELWDVAAWTEQAVTLQDHKANVERFEKFDLSLA